MTIRTDTSLHPSTVTNYDDHTQLLVTSRYNRGTWATRTKLRRVDPSLLTAAIATAGGDRDRLWFDNDGSIWILNHRRDEKCRGGGCPVCKPAHG